MKIPIICFAATLAVASCAHAAEATAPLRDSAPTSGTTGSSIGRLFSDPPADAYPGAFWHWQNGNVSKEGITADLEAMKRAGIDTPIQFSIGALAPEGQVGFGTDAYFDMLEHTAKEAKRLGMTFGFHNADSWSGSGGPWITPEMSMQTLTFSDLRVKGPGRISIELPKPAHRMDYYRDLAVFAVACPSGAAVEDPMNGASLRSGVEIPDASAFLAPRSALSKGTEKPVTLKGEETWFEIDLARPADIRSVEIRGEGGQMPACRILVEEEGGGMKLVRESAAEFWVLGGKNYEVFAFAPVRTSKIRVEFRGSLGFNLTGIRASDLDAVEDWPGKSGYVGFCEVQPETQERPDLSAVPPVIDLASAMSANGTLDWDVPEGVWRVVRLGHTTSGQHNAPATKLGYGLECDKLSKQALDLHFNSYVARCLKRFGESAGPVAAWILTDSWELGEQNWTARFPEEFRKRRGYDIERFLPVLAGVIVDSPAASDRFLWDFRHTISEMIADNYYGHLAALAAKNGLHFAAEPYTVGAAAMGFDQLRAACSVDMPMTEFWTGTFRHVPIPEERERLPNHFHETKQVTSAAHSTGRPVIGAEAFTAFSYDGRWTNHPWSLKEQGDRMFCLGVNRFFLHCMSHQPWPRWRPGFSLDNWGSHFDSTNTWFDAGADWLAYLARSQALLQSGRFVADVAYYPGDHGPNVERRLDEVGESIPPGHDWDAVSGHLLMDAIVKNGDIVLPSGMRYRLLVLNDIPQLTAPMAAVLRRLVKDGASVLGPRPVGSPSLADKNKGDAEVIAFAREFWGDGEQGSRRIGKGTVYWGMSTAEALAAMGVEPDCVTSQESSDPMLKNWIHRRTGNDDLYFVRNTLKESANLRVSLRAAGRKPELWWPDSGRIEQAPLWRTSGERTELDVELPPLGSVFVVLREPLTAGQASFVSLRGEGEVSDSSQRLEGKPDGIQMLASTAGRRVLTDSKGGEHAIEVAAPPAPLALPGPWKLSFPSGLGAPKSVQLPSLVSWTEHENPGVRHFSGTATYRMDFELPADWLPGDRTLHYEIDLGDVRHLAVVRLNGIPLGTLWKPPFRCDATTALRPGRNVLEIEATNLWANRLIGDESLPEDCQWNGKSLATIPDWIKNGEARPSGRIAFASYRHWTKDDELLTSGLLGPVSIRPLRVVDVRQPAR